MHQVCLNFLSFAKTQHVGLTHAYTRAHTLSCKITAEREESKMQNDL